MVKSPVMFVVEIGAVFATVSAVLDPSVFGWSVVVWLWLTVVFANLAEAVAEGRGKAQAATLRKTRTETSARRRLADGREEEVSAVPAHGSATSSSWWRGRPSRVTATSSRASPAWTSRRSRASPPR